ncbi:MAG: ribonuclease Y [Patescibacteria group bacterium]
MSDALFVVGLLFSAAIGASAGYALRSSKIKKDEAAAEIKYNEIVKAAEDKQQEVLVKAKEKAVKIIEEARIEEKRGLDELKNQQTSLLEREQAFSSKLLEIDKTKQDAETAKQRVEDIKKQLEEIREAGMKRLEEISGFNKEQALARITELVEQENSDALLSRIRKLDEVASDEIERRANNILALAIQRQASSQVAETTTAYVELPSDEMKGRIIGREGRNIKAIELLTGCELIIDETPNLVTISGFSPIRRQVAKRALSKLIADGRIHPGRIEETIEESKKELAIDIKKAGEDALYQLGISMAGIDPKLIQILGRLKFRTSYGQSALQHSMEVASISALLAEELGANVKTCRIGGLFHDVGKAVDHDMQGSHPELGLQIMKKFGFPEEICYQCIGHHEDKPKTLEGVIVKAADAISGARPGARKDSLELYVKRLEDLENAATSFDGVEKVYAIQAGREIRVFVNPKVIDDLTATKLARDIANKIEAELKHPGEIRVTVIRETRVIEYAR